MTQASHTKPATRAANRHRLAASALLCLALPAQAIPPPPPRPPQVGEARMTATVKLYEARNGSVTKITQLCQVTGAIPVYADDGPPAPAHEREIAGCTMVWKGATLPVFVAGALARKQGAPTFATASVSVTPPDAVPLCEMCAPQPLADASSEVKVGGIPKLLKFSLSPNPVSLLNAKTPVWLEAEIEIRD